MPETKAYSHSQGLGFCGKVQAGQRNAKRGIAHTVFMTQTQRHIDKVEVFLQRGVSPHEREQFDCG